MISIDKCALNKKEPWFYTPIFLKLEHFHTGSQAQYLDLKLGPLLTVRDHGLWQRSSVLSCNSDWW